MPVTHPVTDLVVASEDASPLRATALARCSGACDGRERAAGQRYSPLRPVRNRLPVFGTQQPSGISPLGFRSPRPNARPGANPPDMAVAMVVVFNAAWPKAAQPTLPGVVLVGGAPSGQRRGFG